MKTSACFLAVRLAPILLGLLCAPLTRAFVDITTFETDALGAPPTSWEIISSSKPTTVSPGATQPVIVSPGVIKNSQSVYFVTSGQSMRRTITATTGLQWDGWIKLASATSRSLTLGSADSAQRYGFWLSFGVTSGKVSYYAGGAWQTLSNITLSANKWYRFRIVARAGAEPSFDFYLSGAGDGSLPVVPQGDHLPLRDPSATDFSRVEVNGTSLASAAWFDDSALASTTWEAFEDDAIGTFAGAPWSVTGSPAVTTPGANGSAKALRSTTSGDRLTHYLDSDNLTLDFKIKSDATTRSLTVSASDLQSRQGPYVAFGVASGKVSSYYQNAWHEVPGFTFAAGNWYRVRMNVRLYPTEAFDLYVGAANSATLPTNPTATNLPFRTAGLTSLSSVSLESYSLQSAYGLDAMELNCVPYPATPVVTLPVAGSTSYVPTPSFTWTAIDGAERYEIQIASDNTFNTIIDQDTTRVPHYAVAGRLPYGTLYWRVRACSPEGLVGDYSTVSTVTLQEPTTVYDIPNNADTATIESLLTDAATHTPAILRFAQNGTYSVAPSYYDLLRVTGINNLIVEGNGATITFTDPMAGLARIDKCNNILIQDLTIRYQTLPYTVGVVQSVNATDGRFTVKLDNASMVPFDQPPISTNWTWGVLLDPTVPGKLLDGAPIVIGTVANEVVKTTDLEGKTLYTLRLSDKANAAYFAVGSKYIQFARNPGGRSLATAYGGSEVAFLNMTNYGVSAGHYLSIESSGFKVLGCRSLIPAGCWFGGNADGVHARANNLGPWVEGCRFEGIGDDSVALYSKGIFILHQDSATALRLGTDFFNLTPGTRICVFNPRAGALVAEDIEVDTATYKPKDADGYSVAHYLVTLKTPITASLYTASTDGINNDQVFNRSMVNRDFVIRGNTFSGVRRYGSVIRAVSGVIENNVYERVSDVPVFFRNEPDYWRNGLHSAGVLVVGNTIRDSGFSRGAQGKAQIQTILYKLGTTPAAARAQRDITISGNVIENWQERAIEISNADSVRVTGNFITSDVPTFSNTRTHYGIYIDNSQNVDVSGNLIDDPRPLDATIHVTGNTANIQVAP